MSLIPAISVLADRVRDRINSSPDKSEFSVNNKIWDVIKGAGIGEGQKHRYFNDIQRERRRRATEVRRKQAAEKKAAAQSAKEAARRYP